MYGYSKAFFFSFIDYAYYEETNSPHLHRAVDPTRVAAAAPATGACKSIVGNASALVKEIIVSLQKHPIMLPVSLTRIIQTHSVLDQSHCSRHF